MSCARRGAAARAINLRFEAVGLVLRLARDGSPKLTPVLPLWTNTVPVTAFQKASSPMPVQCSLPAVSNCFIFAMLCTSP